MTDTNSLEYKRVSQGCQVPSFTPLGVSDRTGPAVVAHSSPLRDSFGLWLEDMADWDWYATLTFRNPQDDRFPNWSQVGWNSAHNALRKLNAALVTALEDNPLWVACMELQKRGVPHWHLLVANVGNARRLYWKEWWFERYGIARILPYSRELGARYYLGKYLTKEVADIRFSPALMATMGRR